MGAEGLSARGLRFSYGRHEVLRGVGFVAPRGRWIAVLGPNGCGKSTLLALLAGLLRPSGGEVLVDGHPLASLSARERGRRLSLVTQHGERPDGLSVEEVVSLGRLPHLGLLGRAGPADRAAVDAALARCEVETLLGRDVATLSGGELQRVHLARAVASAPDHLLLDEPTNHLDLHHQVGFLRLVGRLRAEGVGVVTVLHDPNQAWCADVVCLMQGGRVVAEGPPDEVLTTPVLAGVYGPEVAVERTVGGRAVVVPWGAS